MSIREKISKLSFFKDQILAKKYGTNIHDVDITETIETGIVDRLMQARELGIDYCVVFGGTIPMGKSWDKYGNGEWNPPRDYITTDDIRTEDNDRETERQNVYRFLRGEELRRSGSVRR